MAEQNMTQNIGNTPLIELSHLIDSQNQTRIYAKAEYLNPGGSIKDRIALNMIEKAWQRGEITADTTLIEATSGNTGIGLAMVCAAKGLNLILTMPESMSIERRKLLEHLGAKIVLTSAKGGMAESVQKAQELSKTISESFLVHQFSNPDNPSAHYENTSKEIISQLDDKIDVFVAGVGTGGTITGIGKRFKEIYPDIKIVAVEPAASAVLSGQKAGPHKIQGIGAGFIPNVLDMNLIDEIITIEDKEAISYAKDAASKAGLLVGISSGANLAAAYMLAKKRENQGKNIVTVLPDTAERYLSTDLFS